MEATQNSLFDFPKVEITKPIRLIELFGGYEVCNNELAFNIVEY